MSDIEFTVHIIDEICNFAISNDMEPDDTLATIAENILELLEINTFNNWSSTEEVNDEDNS